MKTKPAAALAAMLVLSAAASVFAAPPPSLPRACTGKAVATDGHRLLALVVGVGKYRSKELPALAGPANDVQAMVELLKRYRFPEANICVLIDEQATTAAFRAAFDQALVARAQPGDVTVVYLAGHGSLYPDENGDEETDGYDSTFLFHDARVGDVGDYIDDKFNEDLARLHGKTRNIVVISDSCNSGTLTRDARATTLVARFVPPARTREAGAGRAVVKKPWKPDALPGLVAFTAAADGTSAFETGGLGIFTHALVEVFSRSGKDPLTYAQAARQIPPLLAARGGQIPYFQGALDREVFGTASRARPLAWEVKRAGPVLELQGPPMPSMGVGAELRIYTPTLSRAHLADPAKAKATVVVTEMTGLNANARVSAARESAPVPTEGDLAILVRPADKALRMSVRLRPSREPGGIDKARAEKVRRAIAADPDAKHAVTVTEERGDFELSVAHEGRLQLRDPDDKIRNIYDSDHAVARNSWQHARQKALREIRGEGGGLFTDESTLKVRLVPAPKQRPCGRARHADWVQSEPNREQIVPLCVSWQIEVTNTGPVRLRVGGVVLSNDGSVIGFPDHGKAAYVGPGRTVKLDDAYDSGLPLDTAETVRVFGTLETEQVDWYRLTEGAVTRSAIPVGSALEEALDRYISMTRGTARQQRTEAAPFTVSSLTFRVKANAGFLEPKPGSRDALTPREYSIPNFDLRPYYPDNTQTALYRVLTLADKLAKTKVGYRQHAWKEGSDQKNLEKGIDCSRFAWFVFTRSSLPYIEADAYLTTAQMVGNDSPMSKHFERCDTAGQFQLGDLLVYRDDARAEGHVVMVIDPLDRIAVGSHGWDGNARAPGVAPLTGVQYQKIKLKKDWQRWDKPAMQAKACWRYRHFAEEARQEGGRPGMKAWGADPCVGSCPVSHLVPASAWPPAAK